MNRILSIMEYLRLKFKRNGRPLPDDLPCVTAKTLFQARAKKMILLNEQLNLSSKDLMNKYEFSRRSIILKLCLSFGL